MAFYDRVLVLDKGEVSEYDTPLALLEKEDSVFRSMCEKVSHAFLLFSFPPLLSSVLDAVGKRRKQRFQVVSYPFVFQSLETVKACRHSRDHDGVYVGVVCSNAGPALVQRADDLTAEPAILERDFKPVSLHP